MSDPDPELLAAALRGADRGKRLFQAVEDALVDLEIPHSPGDVAYIAEEAWNAISRPPARSDQ